MEKNIIFISYSRKDKEKVFEIRDEIEKVTRQKCWIDLDGIESDRQFEEVIIEAINKADIFVFMYSSNSEKSEWTKAELRFADNKGKRIVFIKLDEKPLSDWYSFKFSGHDIIDYSSEDQKQKLLRNLCEWCGTNELKKEEEKKRAIIKEELINLAKEYHRELEALSADIEEINAKMSSIGINYRTCPICNNNVELANQYCSNCGCTISPIEGIEGAEFLLEHNKTQHDIIKRYINSNNDNKKQDAFSNDISDVIYRYRLQDVLSIHSANGVYNFIRKFCSSSEVLVGCSGEYAELKIYELSQSLDILYSIKMPDYDMQNSIWSLAEKLWNENRIKFENTKIKFEQRPSSHLQNTDKSCSFKCDDCGYGFVAPAAKWCATDYIAPAKCPKCGSMHTYPDNFGGLLRRGLYKNFWERLSDNMSIRQSEAVDRSSWGDSDAMYSPSSSPRCSSATFLTTCGITIDNQTRTEIEKFKNNPGGYSELQWSSNTNVKRVSKLLAKFSKLWNHNDNYTSHWDYTEQEFWAFNQNVGRIRHFIKAVAIYNKKGVNMDKRTHNKIIDELNKIKKYYTPAMYIYRFITEGVAPTELGLVHIERLNWKETIMFVVNNLEKY